LTGFSNRVGVICSLSAYEKKNKEIPMARADKWQRRPIADSRIHIGINRDKKTTLYLKMLSGYWMYRKKVRVFSFSLRDFERSSTD